MKALSHLHKALHMHAHNLHTISRQPRNPFVGTLHLFLWYMYTIYNAAFSVHFFLISKWEDFERDILKMYT